MAGPAPEWLAVGRIRKPHGVHGELVAEPVTDRPERVQPGIEIGIGLQGPGQPFRIHTLRWHKGLWLLALEGVTRCEDVEPLRNHWLFLPTPERASLPPTYYYEHELVGAHCRDEQGHDLGEVTALLPGGAQSLLAIRTADGREVLAPFISPIVVRVELPAGIIVLDPPRGLFDDDAL